MALNDESPKLSRVGGPAGTRIPATLMILVVALLALAVLKPWNVGNGGSRLTVSAPPLSPTPSVKPSDPADYVAQPGRLFPQCYATAGWRVAALQSTPDYEVRTVWPVLLAESTTPEAALAAARLVAGGEVRGIGYCAPGSDEETRIAYVARVTLWQADDAGRLTPVQGAPAIDQDLADLGEVYLAPPPGLSTNGAWPSGRYIFKADAGDGYATWFALHVVDAVPSVPAHSAAPESSSPSP